MCESANRKFQLNVMNSICMSKIKNTEKTIPKQNQSDFLPFIFIPQLFSNSTQLGLAFA